MAKCIKSNQRFITKNTFEEKINLLINSKKDLADMTVNTGEKWIGELNNQEMEALFSISESNLDRNESEK